MHDYLIIQDLAVILLVAVVVGWFCQKLGLSVVVGFLAAGMVVGPFTPPMSLVSDVGRVATLAQVGLVFLMFSIGLKLSLRRLRKMGFGLLVAVFGSAALVFYVTRMVGALAGLSHIQGMFLAAMFMASSSAIIGKVLHEVGATHERVGQMAMGVTVMEDVVAVVMLTLLNSTVRIGSVEAGGDVLGVLGSFGAFVVFAVVVGILLVPWMLRRMSAVAGEELQTIGLAGLLFGMSILSVKSGYSLALGAFLLGTIVAETPHRVQVERLFEGMRDIFTAVFFVAIGMQINLGELWGAAGVVVALAVFAVVVRASATSLGLMLVGGEARDSIRVGLSVTPIGEFSFIIAQLGVSAAVLPGKYYPIAVGVSLLTSLAAPWLTRHADGVAGRVLELRPRWATVMHENYQRWLESLLVRQKRNLIWQMSKKRLVQIGVGMLFVSGILLFSERILEVIEAKLGKDWLFPRGPMWMFIVAMTLVVLGPMLALWRNISAMSLFFAELTLMGQPMSVRLRPVVEVVYKVVGVLVLAAWLTSVAPLGAGTGWVLLTCVVGGILAVMLVGRKLVYWHSELEVGLQDAWRGQAKGSSETKPAWASQHDEWELHVKECVLPDLADCQGKRILDLKLRTLLGCTIVGVSRQGFMISLPGPETVLFPRDRVLLMGTAEQVNAGAKFLSAIMGAGETPAELEDVRMEQVVVPEWSQALERTLVDVAPARMFRVQVAGIRRGEQRLLSPSGEEKILSGDELLVLGTPDQIRDFREWLRERPTGTSE